MTNTDKIIFLGKGFAHIFVGDESYVARPGVPLELPAWKCAQLVQMTVAGNKIYEYAGEKKSPIMIGTGVKDLYIGHDIFIIGSGASLKGFDFSQLDGLITIALNGVINALPGASMLLFSEESFLRGHDIDNYNGIVFSSTFTSWGKGYKFGFAKKLSARFEDGLYCSQLSGIMAINLALIMGARMIYLLGFDLDGSYFYKEVKSKIFKESYKGKVKLFDEFKCHADKIKNCSETSLLTQFEHMPFEDARRATLRGRNDKTIPIHSESK